jgi:AcrR family transcriptional regulator
MPMMIDLNPAAEAAGAVPAAFSYDPTAPVPPPSIGRIGFATAPSRQNQRRRRAMILATIRQLIIEEGGDGVTVRRIAECSGHAIQTIYNLVGPRDTAIAEAIGEYSRYVGLSDFDPANPEATADVVEHQLRSIEQNPEFCRKVCLMYFTGSRDIYYAFKDKQTKTLATYFARQQQLGLLRPDVDVRETASQIMLYCSALCLEWADRGFALDELRQRFYQGYYNLLSSAIASPGERLLFALTTRGALN